MRVTQNMMVMQFLKNIEGINEKLLVNQYKISTGVNYSKPSDGPLEIGHILTFYDQERKIGQFQKNITNGLSQVENLDTLLQSMVSRITQARTSVVHGSNDPLSSSDKKAVALSINQHLLATLDDSQNRFRDKYIFAGFETLATPFKGVFSKWDQYLSTVDFKGDMGQLHRSIGELNRLHYNIDGKNLFMEKTYTLKGNYLPEKVPLGFNGKLTINEHTISVKASHTLNDIRNMINAIDDIKVHATTKNGYLQLESTTSSNEIEITDNQNGILLDDLGLNLRGAFNKGINGPTLPVIDSTGAIFDGAGAVTNLVYDSTNNVLNLHLGANANEGASESHSITIPEGTYADATELAEAIQIQIDNAFGSDKIKIENVAGVLRLTTVATGAAVGTADLRVGGEIDGTWDSASDSADLNLVASPDPAPMTNAGTAGTDGTDKFTIDLGILASRNDEDPQPVIIDLRAANTGTLTELIDEINYQISQNLTLRSQVSAREDNGRVLIETVKTGYKITSDQLKLEDSTAGTLAGLGFLEDPTKAHIDGIPIAGFPVTITAGINDTLEIDLGPSVSRSGVNLDPVTLKLRPGAYADINALVAEINTQIQSAPDLFGSISVSAAGPVGSEYISISSMDDGSDVRGIDLRITAGSTLADLGLAIGIAIDGGGTSEGKGIEEHPQNIFNTLIEIRDSLLGLAMKDTLLSGLTNEAGAFAGIFEGDVITIEEEGRSIDITYRSTDSFEDLVRSVDRFLGGKAKARFDRSGRLVIENLTTRKITGLKISAKSTDGIDREIFNQMFHTESEVLGFHSIATDSLFDPTRDQSLGDKYLAMIDEDMENFLSHQAYIGATANRLENTSTLLINRDFNTKSDRNELESANIAEVIMQLGQLEAQLQAALNVGGRVLTMSLLSYLR
ncbi:hypothetical protein KKB99_01435 [bacterium]|nr:hypothetical protein [bacterium]MBU1024648.1 hypothetical protein [bacterium]